MLSFHILAASFAFTYSSCPLVSCLQLFDYFGCSNKRGGKLTGEKNWAEVKESGSVDGASDTLLIKWHYNTTSDLCIGYGLLGQRTILVLQQPRLLWPLTSHVSSAKPSHNFPPTQIHPLNDLQLSELCPGVLAIRYIRMHLFAVFYIIARISLLKLPSHINPAYGIPFIMYLDAPSQIPR